MTIHAIIASGISKIKTMKKPSRRLPNLFARLKTAPVLAAVILLVAGGASITIVHAASIQQQIDSLSAQNNKAQSSVSDLQLQASSYQDAIKKLQGEISAIQGAINASEAKQAELKAQIDANQVKLDQQKKVLGEDLKAMYVGGSMSTVEMLATSKNLSDFVDAETYDSAVQGKIQSTLDEITKLQNQLEAQQEQVQQLLDSQNQQQDRLASDQNEQQQLLSMNQNQQNQYNNQIVANEKKITSLEAEQAAINAASTQAVNVLPASGGSGGACENPDNHANGGYPMGWCDATQDSIPTIPYSSDPINRECTSFAYWYFTSMEGKSLHVTGNAKDWVYTSSRPVTQTPHRGDIGVKTEGPFGHVVIVLALSGEDYNGYTVPSGEVLTMSMNYDYNGHFHTSTYSSSSLQYIH